MNYLAIVYMCDEVQPLVGKYIIIDFDDEEELKKFENRLDSYLGRGDYYGELPQATLIELFQRRAFKESPGENGNDLVFVNAWSAPLTRKEALKHKYGTSTGK